MSSNFNKKKIIFFPNLNIFKYLIITISFFSLIIFTYYKLKNKDELNDFIQNISEKFNYQLINFEINSLNRVAKSEVLNVVEKYYNNSIFLIPLEDISIAINDLIWVKSVNLSTNFKNTVNIEILEYIPVGLFFYNNQLFYFSSEGKIIDLADKNNGNFIIFHGKQVLQEANNFLKFLSKKRILNMITIKEAYYINERRWDIKLDNEILLNLSEKNIEESIVNYIKLLEKLDKSDVISINKIDLRNREKAIISFK